MVRLNRAVGTGETRFHSATGTSTSRAQVPVRAASVHLDPARLIGIEEAAETGASQNSERCEYASSSDRVGGALPLGEQSSHGFDFASPASRYRLRGTVGHGYRHGGLAERLVGRADLARATGVDAWGGHLGGVDRFAPAGAERSARRLLRLGGREGVR